MYIKEQSKEDYRVRIRWLIIGRLILFSLLLISLIFFQLRYRISPFPTAYFNYILLLILLITVAYWYVLPRSQNHALFAYFQIFVDILLVTVLVYLTGGIDSGLSILYHLTIISASIILYRKGGFLSASLSSILYGGMLDLQYYEVPGFVRSENFTAMQVLYRVFINILSFYVVGFLSSYLSDRLRKTRQELRDKSIDFDDLRNLQEHILRSVGSGILTMDNHGRVTSWNPAAEIITGYAEDEIKQNIHRVFGSSMKGLFGHTNEMQSHAFRFEGEILKKDGTKVILGMATSLLKDEYDFVRGIIIVFQDITRVVEMEEKMRRQERLATVGSLAAGIAHELRNPLASLSGSIQLLRKELTLRDDDKRLMDIVLRETDRLNTIIGEFLDYARPRPPRKERIRVAAMIDETILLMRNSPYSVNSVNIIQDVESEFIVNADPMQLRQIIWNLVLNACQAIEERGTVYVSVRPVKKTGVEYEWCEIVVSDTGKGIPREHMGNLFNPFFTTKPDGTGLGLAIVYRIVQDHGGIVDVCNQDGGGATFSVRLPMKEGKPQLLSQLQNKS